MTNNLISDRCIKFSQMRYVSSAPARGADKLAASRRLGQLVEGRLLTRI